MKRDGSRVLTVAVLLALAGDAAARQPEHVVVRVRDGDAGSYVEAENLSRVAYEVRVERRKRGGDGTYHLVPPGEKTVVLRFDGLTLEEATEAVAKYRFETFMGDPAAIEPDESYLYRLPFRAGKTYRLTQGFDGKGSHDHPASRYALDFQLEVGEPVHAARGGLVVKVVERYREAGDRSLVSKANVIIVLHDDGTIAHYVHLDYRGSLVKEGDRVERGQRIGTSGMTGYTEGPHLHFVVRKARDLAVPVRFEGYAGADLSKPGGFRVGGP